MCSISESEIEDNWNDAGTDEEDSPMDGNWKFVFPEI